MPRVGPGTPYVYEATEELDLFIRAASPETRETLKLLLDDIIAEADAKSKVRGDWSMTLWADIGRAFVEAVFFPDPKNPLSRARR